MDRAKDTQDTRSWQEQQNYNQSSHRPNYNQGFQHHQYSSNYSPATEYHNHQDMPPPSVPSSNTVKSTIEKTPYARGLNQFNGDQTHLVPSPPILPPPPPPVEQPPAPAVTGTRKKVSSTIKHFFKGKDSITNTFSKRSTEGINNARDFSDSDSEATASDVVENKAARTGPKLVPLNPKPYKFDPSNQAFDPVDPHSVIVNPEVMARMQATVAKVTGETPVYKPKKNTVKQDPENMIYFTFPRASSALKQTTVETKTKSALSDYRQNETPYEIYERGVNQRNNERISKLERPYINNQNNHLVQPLQKHQQTQDHNNHHHSQVPPTQQLPPHVQPTSRQIRHSHSEKAQKGQDALAQTLAKLSGEDKKANTQQEAEQGNEFYLTALAQESKDTIEQSMSIKSDNQEMKTGNNEYNYPLETETPEEAMQNWNGFGERSSHNKQDHTHTRELDRTGDYSPKKISFSTSVDSFSQNNASPMFTNVASSPQYPVTNNTWDTNPSNLQETINQIMQNLNQLQNDCNLYMKNQIQLQNMSSQSPIGYGYQTTFMQSPADLNQAMQQMNQQYEFLQTLMCQLPNQQPPSTATQLIQLDDESIQQTDSTEMLDNTTDTVQESHSNTENPLEVHGSSKSTFESMKERASLHFITAPLVDNSQTGTNRKQLPHLQNRYPYHPQKPLYIGLNKPTPPPPFGLPDSPHKPHGQLIHPSVAQDQAQAQVQVQAQQNYGQKRSRLHSNNPHSQTTDTEPSMSTLELNQLSRDLNQLAKRISMLSQNPERLVHRTSQVNSDSNLYEDALAQLTGSEAIASHLQQPQEPEKSQERSEAHKAMLREYGFSSNDSFTIDTESLNSNAEAQQLALELNDFAQSLNNLSLNASKLAQDPNSVAKRLSHWSQRVSQYSHHQQRHSRYDSRPQTLTLFEKPLPPPPPSDTDLAKQMNSARSVHFTPHLQPSFPHNFPQIPQHSHYAKELYNNHQHINYPGIKENGNAMPDRFKSITSSMTDKYSLTMQPNHQPSGGSFIFHPPLPSRIERQFERTPTPIDDRRDSDNPFYEELEGNDSGLPRPDPKYISLIPNRFPPPSTRVASPSPERQPIHGYNHINGRAQAVPADEYMPDEQVVMTVKDQEEDKKKRLKKLKQNQSKERKMFKAHEKELKKKVKMERDKEEKIMKELKKARKNTSKDSKEQLKQLPVPPPQRPSSLALFRKLDVKYKESRLLGTGSCSRVYILRNFRTNRFFAGKAIPRVRLMTHLWMVRNEFAIFRRITSEDYAPYDQEAEQNEIDKYHQHRDEVQQLSPRIDHELQPSQPAAGAAGAGAASKPIREPISKTIISYVKNPFRLKVKEELHGSFFHPNLTYMIDMFLTADSFYFVTPLALGPTLKQHVMSTGPMPECTAKKVIKQLVSGIKFMHDRGIAHRNLTLENVVFKRRIQSRNKRDENSDPPNIEDFGKVFPIQPQAPFPHPLPSPSPPLPPLPNHHHQQSSLDEYADFPLDENDLQILIVDFRLAKLLDTQTDYHYAELLNVELDEKGKLAPTPLNLEKMNALQTNIEFHQFWMGGLGTVDYMPPERFEECANCGGPKIHYLRCIRCAAKEKERLQRKMQTLSKSGPRNSPYIHDDGNDNNDDDNNNNGDKFGKASGAAEDFLPYRFEIDMNGYLVQYDPRPGDIWAMGVIMFVLLCGRFPFSDGPYEETQDGDDDDDDPYSLDKTDMYDRIVKTNYEYWPVDVWSQVSPNTKGFLEGCLNKDAMIRMWPEECMLHPFLRERKKD